ncbi:MULTISPECIES: hypothetical protein [unclassified Achromobacter]|uniref:hypothetical protein n=1 Tax=unclassified Achromobacter TaxID=2626865 RepID=UPI000B51D117|nr:MULTISPECIES: hypothetical protein [unclassified Achromobacter]OWT77237.1 hypothetical protein CEY04_14830 [Achromobacter sp. HZ28]OWT78118.1 hypothetical protein CEY05_09325 [Achromobacter sp. HZ34]
MTAAIWEISVSENGAKFWLEDGRRYVVCLCSADVLRRVEARTGLQGSAALRAVQGELIQEAHQRLVDQEPPPLRLLYHD